MVVLFFFFGGGGGLQIAQNRPYLHTLGPKVGIIYIHGALGVWWSLKRGASRVPLKGPGVDIRQVSKRSILQLMGYSGPHRVGT